MNLNYLNKYVNFIFLTILVYCLVFLGSHYITPNLGEIAISIDTNMSNPQFQNITISVEKSFSTYYILVYEPSSNAQWIYFSSSKYANDISTLIENFVDTTKNKYLVFQGNKSKHNFTFTIKSKYTSNYITNKDHLFHVYYIIPHPIFPFTSFYYSKHFYFFVNPMT